MLCCIPNWHTIISVLFEMRMKSAQRKVNLLMCSYGRVDLIIEDSANKKWFHEFAHIMLVSVECIPCVLHHRIHSTIRVRMTSKMKAALHNNYFKQDFTMSIIVTER